jgi:hypothetical protein
VPRVSIDSCIIITRVMNVPIFYIVRSSVFRLKSGSPRTGGTILVVIGRAAASRISDFATAIPDDMSLLSVEEVLLPMVLLMVKSRMMVDG